MLNFTITFPADHSPYLVVSPGSADRAEWGAGAGTSLRQRLYHARASGGLVASLRAHPAIILLPGGMARVHGSLHIRAPIMQWMHVGLAHVGMHCVNRSTCQGPLDARYGASRCIAAHAPCLPHNANACAELTFANGLTFWTTHFGAHERGVVEVNVAAAACHTALALLAGYVGWQLWTLGKLHRTVLILLVSILVQALAMALEIVNGIIMGATGKQSSALALAAELAAGAAEVLLVLHLMLTAVGWTIVLRKLRAADRERLAAFVTLYAILRATAAVGFSKCAPSTFPSERARKKRTERPHRGRWNAQHWKATEWSSPAATRAGRGT